MTTDDSQRPAGRPDAPEDRPDVPEDRPDVPEDRLDVPDEATLAAIATPAVVRRAPRIGAFIRTGVLVGAVVAWLLAVLFTGTTGEGRTGAIIMSTVGGAGFGALLGAGVAALLDRRGTRAAGRPPGDPPSL